MSSEVVRTRYLLNRTEEDYVYNDSLAICANELILLFPEVGEKIYVTFSNRPITDVAVSGEFAVVPYNDFNVTLEYNRAIYGYLYKWLRARILSHKDENGFVFIGVENCDQLTDICDKCGLERDSEGYCKYGCDDFC